MLRENLRSTVLILSNADDGHAHAVERHLHELGVDVAQLNTETLGSAAGLTVEWGKAATACSVRLCVDGIWIESEQVKSVWYRRPKPSGLEGFQLSDLDLDFARDQWEAALHGTLALLGEALWVSPPGKITAAAKKPFQLQLAREIGLATPATCITSNPDTALAFVEGAGGPVVAKVIGRGWSRLDDDGEPEQVVYTNVVEPGHLRFLRDLPIAPVILQEYVPKVYEVRATVVGQRLFPVKIESQKSERTSIDWRRYDPEQTPYGPYSLPGDVEDRCLELVRRLGLQYGAVDLIRRPDGEYVFLEINPSGQFLWAESLSGVPISRAIARLLAGLEAPL